MTGRYMSISYRYQGTASAAHRGMVETNELKKVNFERTYGQISNVTVCKNFSTIYLCLQTNPSTSTGKREKKRSIESSLKPNPDH